MANVIPDAIDADTLATDHLAAEIVRGVRLGLAEEGCDGPLHLVKKERAHPTDVSHVDAEAMELARKILVDALHRLLTGGQLNGSASN